MKKSTKLLRIFSFTMALIMLFSAIPAIPSALAQEDLPNNAKAIVARGEDAFKSTEHEFSANWIWSPSDNGASNRWMAFRKEVTLDSSDLSGEITARISADSKYWLWINGEMAVFEGQLKRGAALLYKDVYTEENPGQPGAGNMFSQIDTYFDQVVLTPYLSEGENVIVALVYYYGNDGHSHVDSGKAAFLFESQMGDELIVSDSTWLVSRHKGYQASSRIGGHSQEYHTVYDARAGFDDFFKPEYDASEWENASVIGAVGDKPWNNLWQRSIPQWKVWDRVSYTTKDTENVTKISGGYRVSFPTNIHYCAYIKVSAPAGKTIKISSPNSGNYSVKYITKGGENGEAVIQEFESLQWINWWFANYEIPAGVEVIELGYRQTGYNTEFTGYFESNDEFFDTLWRKARDTAYVNIRDTFMDCPDAERCAWFGDMVNEAQIAYYTMDSSVFDAIRKDISLRINWQNSDGVIPTTAPNTFRYNEYSELTGQSLAGIMSWFQYYLYSGDRASIEQAYPALLKYIEMFELDVASFSVPFKRRNGTNTMHLSWVDWGDNIDKDLCLNIWAYIGVKTVIDFAELLSDEETAEYYRAVRGVMASKFDAMFWNGKEYRSSTYSGAADDRAQALAVYAGLVSPDKYPLLRDILLNNRFASPYMVKYSIEALYIMGYPEAAEQRMRESYEYDVALGDPTFSERWHGEGTKNHGWSGGGLISLSGYAAGVRPLAGGYDSFIVKPQLGSQLTDIRAGIPSPKGVINVELSKKSEIFEMKVNVPVGSKALLAVPRLEAADTAVKCGSICVWNNGAVDFDVDGLEYAYSDFSHIYFNAQPGEWSFTSVRAENGEGDSFALRIAESENGSVFVNGVKEELPYEGIFAAGSEIVLSTEPNENCCFAGFNGSIGSREPEVTFVMNSDKSVSADFEALQSFNGYEVTATSNKKAKLLVNGMEGSFPYNDICSEGSSITLTAQENEELVFSEWRDSNGNILSVERQIVIDVTGRINVFACYSERLGENLALEAKFTSSSSVENNIFSIENANDGIYTETNVNEGWSSDELLTEQWICAQLGRNITIGAVKLYPRMVGGESAYGIPEDMEILVSSDGFTWRKVYSVTGQIAPLIDGLTYTFEPVEAMFVKINGSKLRANPDDAYRKRFQVAEVEIFSAVSDGAPVILSQSETAYGQADTTADISVLAVGEMPIYYQWQVSTDGGIIYQDVSNGNSKSYALPFSLDTHGAMYRCIVSNAKGEATSAPILSETVSENYALNVRAMASSKYIGADEYKLSYINDGIRETIVGVNEGWVSKNIITGGAWVQFILDEVTLINRIVLYPRIYGLDAGYGIPEDYVISVSEDGEMWKEVYSVVGAERVEEGNIIIDFAPVSARYVKLEGSKFYKNPYLSNKRRMQIVELEIYWVGGTPVEKGDVDADGVVTVADALMVLQAVARLRELNDAEFRMGDMDGDGVITVADALYILRCVVGLAERPLM